MSALTALFTSTAAASVREGDVLCAGKFSPEFYALVGTLRVVSVERVGSYVSVTAWAMDERRHVEFVAEATEEFSVWAA